MNMGSFLVGAVLLMLGVGFLAFRHRLAERSRRHGTFKQGPRAYAVVGVVWLLLGLFSVAMAF